MNLADVFETIASNIEPDAPAILCDGEVLSWSEFDRKANALARYLQEAGLGVQAKVGLYMRNGPDYLISFVACLKARLCPFNINYRYGAAEIDYLLDNADCEALIFDAEFAPIVSATSRGAGLKARISARGNTEDTASLTDIYQRDDGPLTLTRDSEDLFFIYTGGTTGMPKAVVWPGDAMCEALLPGVALPGKPAPTTLAALSEQIRSGEGRYRFYIAPPLMHGTGLTGAFSALFRGGSAAMTGAASFNPQQMVQEIIDLKCEGLSIVGDAFARPLLDVLRTAQEPLDVSHVLGVVSSGMMWSPDVKKGLLEFMPQATLIDGLGASESTGFASSTTTRDSEPGEAQFELTGAVVLREDDLTPVQPGSGEIGIIAKSGPLPLGYYKDPERTAKTYVTISGVRHVLGGDHAVVESDGTIRLLGRGSHCINTAGEKVYPEEVEEALKTHPAVSDALVFGMANDRFGESVEAVASVREDVQPETLINHVRKRLAAYKAPRRLLIVDNVPRGPNGKADYPTAKALFSEAQFP